MPPFDSASIVSALRDLGADVEIRQLDAAAVDVLDVVAREQHVGANGGRRRRRCGLERLQLRIETLVDEHAEVRRAERRRAVEHFGNTGTGAWCRFTNYDATCFLRMRGDFFFGTHDGLIMRAESGGYDDGIPYVATIVGGWSIFQQQASTSVWHQARASFHSSNAQPFIPQLSGCTDFIVTVPPPPLVGPDPGTADVWDQGKWDAAKWDQSSLVVPPVRNTRWVSIGRTGYSHAPVVQVTVGQHAKPEVELIAIDCTFERAGVNV